MYKVLIVDDEEKMCYLIRDLIHWDDLDLQMAGFANTGLEALDKIEEILPDIVITDIRMPELDGLELISRIYDRKPDISFIVISGYRQFEYATSAIKFGVEDYLLKPIRESELNDTIKKICDRKKLQQDAEIQNQILWQEVMDARQEKWTQLMDELLAKHNICLEHNVLSQKYSCHLPYQNFACVVIKTDVSFHHIEEPETSFINIHILELLKKQLSPWSDTFIFSIQGMYIFSIINYKDDEILLKNRLNILFEDIDKYVMSFDCYTTTMSTAYTNTLSNLPLCYSNAKEMINARIVYGVRQMISMDNCTISGPALSTDRLKQLNSLKSTFNTLDISECSKLLEEIFTGLRRDRPVLYTNYYYILDRIVSILSSLLTENFPKVSAVEITQDCMLIRQYADNARTITEFAQYVTESVRKTVEKFAGIKKQQGIYPIRTAKEYVREHLSEIITIADVARQSGLSSSYFSVVFKQETGINFKDYLTEQRIEKAKNLLRTTNDIIPIISKKVGYTDARYFSNQFEKIVGLKPAKYRKLHT